MKSTVRHLIESKGGHNWSISPEATVYEALKVMQEKNIGVLLVVDNGKLSGIFSERDYARKGVLEGKSAKDTQVSEMMTKRVYYLTPDNALDDCLALMTSKHIRHLPIMEGDQLKGILTLGDVVKQVISNQKFTIQELEKYITGV